MPVVWPIIAIEEVDEVQAAEKVTSDDVPFE
jgi:hypothetical protein